MRPRRVGAGPAYTDRPGATGAAYLLRQGDAALLLDLGQGSFPRLAGADRSGRRSTRSSSATSTRTTSSTSSRSATTCAGRSPAGASGSSGRPASTSGSTRSMTSRASAPPRSTSSRSARARSAIAAVRDRGGPGDPHRVELRVPRVRRGRRARCARARLLRGLRPRRGPRRARPARATRCCARSRSGPARSCRARSTWTGPRSATWRPRTGAGRVLLTHLQMGYDRDATVASVTAALRRRSGRRWSTPGSRRRSRADRRGRCASGSWRGHGGAAAHRPRSIGPQPQAQQPEIPDRLEDDAGLGARRRAGRAG